VQGAQKYAQLIQSSIFVTNTSQKIESLLKEGHFLFVLMLPPALNQNKVLHADCMTIPVVLKD
jgi:hypothetical protein